MSVTKLFEKIAGRQKQREKSRIEDFRGLVRAIANGQEPDADRVDAVLSESGHSLEDLKAAVELLERRMEERARLDTVPKLETEKADLEAKIGKATEIQNAAEAQYEETVNPLRWRLDEIKSDLQQMWNLPQKLVDSCQYPELIVRAEEIRLAKHQAHEEAAKLRRLMEDNLAAIRDYEQKAEKSDHKPHQQLYREQIKRCQDFMAETQAKLKKSLQRIEDLGKQEAVIREEMMVP